jgi:hypothetical protein
VYFSVVAREEHRFRSVNRNHFSSPDAVDWGEEGWQVVVNHVEAAAFQNSGGADRISGKNEFVAAMTNYVSVDVIVALSVVSQGEPELSVTP